MLKQIQTVTEQIIERSEKTRTAYLDRIAQFKNHSPNRHSLSCGNLAHGFAACSMHDKRALRGTDQVNIAIISAYNDLLSAHQPYHDYPELIKTTVHAAGGVAQFAAGVPAMCDGITQGQPGMELSLFSRDVIAMSTAIALSHHLFDGGALLGICDKIVPGLLMAALHFGHLPFLFIPAGPMPSGISNQEKANVRQKFAQGQADRATLLNAEAASYHAPGTCTFYGTANSNQLLIELMGLQLPGSSFIHPGTELRHQLTKAAAEKIVTLSQHGENHLPISKIVTEKTIVNAIVGLLATGGSTNHTMHLVAIARCAGIHINWDDFAALSQVVPLLTRIYPNGHADINAFQHAGGMAYLTHTLLEAELLHEDVETIAGTGLKHYSQQPLLDNEQLYWTEGPHHSENPEVLTSTTQPFCKHGGLQLMSGNIGRAVMKTSAVAEEHLIVEAPAVVFDSQDAVETAFRSGALDRDCIVVLRFQGPKACGMPELHKLTPLLSVLQNRGFHVALLTDGRMSGASGKVPAAIHVTPEAIDGGVLAKIENGDMLLVDGQNGRLQLSCKAQELQTRPQAKANLEKNQHGFGRELFATLRTNCSGAEQGACSLFVNEEDVL